MNLQNIQTENDCPRADLAAYIDGELLPREEIELEAHLADCKVCVCELNEQKKMLSALDFALESEREFRLPTNFTQVVVANAESKVSGLRCRRERFNAVFVIAGLFLLFLIGLGGETKTIVATFLKFGEQILAVGSFAAHLIYNIAVAVSIIARSFTVQFVYNSDFSMIFFAIFFLSALFMLSRVINRHSQAKF